MFAFCRQRLPARRGVAREVQGDTQREKEDEMTSLLDSHQSAAAVNKKLRFETSHEPMLVIL